MSEPPIDTIMPGPTPKPPPRTTRATRLVRVVSPLAVIMMFILGPVAAKANFFSRLVDFGKDKGESKPPPTGATKAMGPTAKVGSIITFDEGIPQVKLANNNMVPLVGFGVGNLQHDRIPAMVASAVQDDKKSRLIDTAHASNNEALVAEGILRGVNQMDLPDGEKLTVHVVTKVWYTHLGYERTKLSVQESLDELKPILESDKVDAKIHLLLHWPRCFKEIPWMNCEKDEEELPQHVKDAGPAPHMDPEGAWKESWKLLEELYLSEKYPIASIGVSNFHLHDLEMMESFARIHPHILQVNVWSLLFDPNLIDYCHKRRIHVQVYNAMHGTIMQPENAPRAFNHMQKVAFEIAEEADDLDEVTPAQVVLAWLIQHGVSVIPRTSKVSRLTENSAVALMKIPALNDHQVETIAHSVEAYLSGDDLEQDIHVSIAFHAVSKDIMLYWISHLDEIRVAHIKQGETYKETTYPNHMFRTYDANNKDVFLDHTIKTNFGGHQDIHVEL